MTEEHRTKERFLLNLDARVAYSFVGKPSSEKLQETVAANISASGAFLRLDATLPLASKVLIEFDLSLDDLKKLKFILSWDSLKNCSGRQVRVKATGVVIRQENDGVAVIFDQDHQLIPLQPAQQE